MPKAVISNRIYLETTPELKASVMKALTYKIKKPPRPGISFGMYDIIKNYKILPNNILSIPAGRLDLVPEDYDLIDKRILVPGTFHDPKLQLREAQQPVYDAVTGSCFINAKVGWGRRFAPLLGN